MVKYNLNHLQQEEHQMVCGPIQDDEALFLYSIVKAMRMKRILEVGGLHGYSAQNFLASMTEGVLYTVDLNKVPKLSSNHIVIQKDANKVDHLDFAQGDPLDLVFFDCHNMSQIGLHDRLVKSGIVDSKTIIALHDTNVHYGVNGKPKVHQRVERDMTNKLKKLGYDVFCLHPRKKNHGVGTDLKFRHGVSICQKFKFLPLTNTACAIGEKFFI